MISLNDLFGPQERGSEPRRGGAGRSPISKPLRGNEGRMRPSIRAMQGKISVISIRCPYCHHHKAIRNDSPNSPNYDRVKCSRCKKTIEV